jgi:hypothetical protein
MSARRSAQKKKSRHRASAHRFLGGRQTALAAAPASADVFKHYIPPFSAVHPYTTNKNNGLLEKPTVPMERSASVLGSFPICAMATGQKVEKALGS